MSALRALRQLTASSSRSLAARSATRAVARATVAARVAPVASRAFSVSAKRLGEGASDVALTQRLAEELKYETEAAPPTEPEFLKAFKAQGTWSIEDTPGLDEVTLTRKFGNEDIRLIFSIADIQTEQEAEFEEGQEGVEEGAEDADAPLHAYPIRCSFSFTKASTPGALTIDAMCQEGTFVIDNISYYSDAKVGTELTAEADWKRRGYYLGPQFDTLDISLQDEFDKFLQERGINQTLAYFVPEYAEHKEQKEYVSWLKNVKDFVEA
ncbi:mitochondrial glyco protein [Dichomitus squalens]|uniref:Mitochondrial glyco protein n=2 Tax=Dichomitus squalens TaxID=114155 RepID=A0A4Q9PZR2_9APHY|nr:mitochondrial glyco protein [Dichomitus squalens LYAD-421 SS1]EJF56802.1 mitochondrial glyco protein [Dichomitus squalens LYAD-421 SS1]TBU40653.1 mitochondrial glyco protein [Dichomitus squalens]TBU60201.1 mitochondrial glyco protein [Dichomitus squalens]